MLSYFFLQEFSGMETTENKNKNLKTIIDIFNNIKVKALVLKETNLSCVKGK